jgi:hypothetical protein
MMDNPFVGHSNRRVPSYHKAAKFVDHVSFFPHAPKHLISISGNKVSSGTSMATRLDQNIWFSHVAFSPDGTQFALCNESAVTVQMLNLGQL